MTREEADFIGGMNMCDEISNEAYKKIMCHCEEQQPCEDCISREQAEYVASGYCAPQHIADELRKLPSVTPKAEWIPVKWHIKTEEDEYEEYPDGVVMIDSPMPEDGQEVLVTIKGTNGKCWVDKDIACCDVDGWYTDGGYDWVDDIIAWMPLPEPYKEGETE